MRPAKGHPRPGATTLSAARFGSMERPVRTVAGSRHRTEFHDETLPAGNQDHALLLDVRTEVLLNMHSPRTSVSTPSNGGETEADIEAVLAGMAEKS